MEVTKWLKPSDSVSRIGEPRLPLWVRSGPTAPPSRESAPGGTADEIGGKADIAPQRSVRRPAGQRLARLLVEMLCVWAAVLRARPCKMAVAAGRVSPDPQPAVEPAALADTPGTAGSLVLCRMDRRGYKRGLVRAEKHGTKSGSGALLRRGFFEGSRSDYLLSWT